MPLLNFFLFSLLLDMPREQKAHKPKRKQTTKNETI